MSVRFEEGVDKTSPLFLQTSPNVAHKSGASFVQELVSKLLTCSASVIVSHQLIYALQVGPNISHTTNLNKRLNAIYLATLRPTEHSLTVFGLKLLLDFINQISQLSWSQYEIGGMSGLLGYLLGRPFDQLETARNQILVNQKKWISRIQAAQVILRYDGWSGFYRSENILGPICGSLYRAIYFGMWNKLSTKNTVKNQMFQFGFLPFLASLSASIATALPDKLRSFCFQANQARRKSLEKVYGKKVQPIIKPTLTLLIQHIASQEFRFSKVDMTAIGHSVIKNWILLSAFAFGQNWVGGNKKNE